MFRITDHLDKLQIVKQTTTKVVAICPVCGEDNLKINLSNHAYSCYSNSCPSSEIRKAIGEPGYVAKLTNVLPPPKPLIASPFPRTFRLLEVENYGLPKENSFFYRKLKKVVQETFYEYSPTQRVKRTDIPGEKKRIVPLCTEDGITWEARNNGFPLYNELYLHPKKAYTYFFVEGEKCATEFTRRIKWLALSPSGGAWSEKTLCAIFRRLFWQIEAIVILPDNDGAGAAKGKLLQECAWRTDIPAKIVSLEDYYQEEGEDVVDLLGRGLDVRGLLEKELYNV